jgi:hypothetical protein
MNVNQKLFKKSTIYYSDPQNLVVSGQISWPTKFCSILKPLLLRIVLIPKLNTIDVSRQ